jgi:Transport protein Avl9
MPINMQDALFQPYLPLQQLDLIKQTNSFLCGSTNAIVRQQKEIELLVDVESCAIEIRDPKIERAVALTPADRKWMDEIVKDVNDTWDTDDGMRSVSFVLSLLVAGCQWAAEGSKAVMTT